MSQKAGCQYSWIAGWLTRWVADQLAGWLAGGAMSFSR